MNLQYVMPEEEILSWWHIGFEATADDRCGLKTTYDSQMLKPVIKELEKNGYRFSNPNIPAAGSGKAYLTRINDKTYLLSHFNNIQIAGDKPTVDTVHATILKHLGESIVGMENYTTEEK